MISESSSLLATDNVCSKYYGMCGRRHNYLTIIPRARMGYESIAHEAEGRMAY